MYIKNIHPFNKIFMVVGDAKERLTPTTAETCIHLDKNLIFRKGIFNFPLTRIHRIRFRSGVCVWILPALMP